MAGILVLWGLGIALFSAVYVTSPTTAVLVTWVVGVLALWRSVKKRVSDSSATPPLEEETPSEDVFAGETGEVERVERGSEGVMFTIHPKRIEVRKED